ncbi:hypothetical protein V8D89_006957 [Ganoderma adspersum]
MSPPLDIAKIIIVKDTNFTGNLITAGVAALVGYDYLLTVQRESRLFWKRRANAATILFFVNRYVALVYYVGLAYYCCLALSYPDCRAQYYVDAGGRYLQYLPWAVFSALRVHALGQRNWFLTVFTFFWAVLAFPLDYYGDFHHTSFVNDPVLGCMPGASTPTALSTIFIRGGQVIADVVVIGVTWKATHYARNEGSMCFLTKVMFRNGNILLVMNILHILFIFLPNSPLHTPLTNTSYVTRFAEPITAILISHFILDLHETRRGMAHQGGVTGVEVMGSDIGRLGPCSRDPEFVFLQTPAKEWPVSSEPSWCATESSG